MTSNSLNIPFFSTADETIDTAFRIAVGDFTSNIQLWKGGLLENPEPCIIAGLGYKKPWTRDAAFNTWYAGGIIAPDIAKNTMLSVLSKDSGKIKISGEYWDKIIWVTGAWKYYLYTGDQQFLKMVLEASKNTLEELENDEYDNADGLFRGGACFQDGVAGYPDKFGDPAGKFCGINQWPKNNPKKAYSNGFGVPCKALSTNCLYYNAYKLISEISEELNIKEDFTFKQKATKLKIAINKHFWSEEKGHYRYLLDAEDDKERQEGLGHAFAILFGIADKKQIHSIMKNQYLTKHGISCVWPPYERYCDKQYKHFPRHSGTIWPQVNTAWVEACEMTGNHSLAIKELQMLATKAVRDSHFFEIYHPITGKPYGGRQEHPEYGGLHEWESCSRQTWCATGYINMIFKSLLGINFTKEGLRLTPHLPHKIEKISLKNIHYRKAILNITITQKDKPIFIPKDCAGTIEILG
ncbi:MAG: amylo-alpha-1,6-glucosidase [Verrucomicrobiota bacterium]|nr:amylo-alpha-1,6-glucosidase [Verrucomicrobiota bacterium]